MSSNNVQVGDRIIWLVVKQRQLLKPDFVTYTEPTVNNMEYKNESAIPNVGDVCSKGVPPTIIKPKLFLLKMVFISAHASVSRSVFL